MWKNPLQGKSSPKTSPFTLDMFLTRNTLPVIHCGMTQTAVSFRNVRHGLVRYYWLSGLSMIYMCALIYQIISFPFSVRLVPPPFWSRSPANILVQALKAIVITWLTNLLNRQFVPLLSKTPDPPLVLYTLLAEDNSFSLMRTIIRFGL